MTNPEESDPIEDSFEVLPAVKNLTLPLGIRCMEVNVQEVDDAVRLFSKKGTDITSPSWKFPHVTLEKLDVTHVMNAFRAHKDLTENQLYMELMELLIDRLYYAIMTSFEFVNGLEAVYVNAGFELENNNGSNNSKRKTSRQSINWDPLEIAKRASEDNTPKPFHTANIGMLVRQFCLKMMGLENIVLNNLHAAKKHEQSTSATARGAETSREEKRRSHHTNNPFLSLRHTETQTSETLQGGCECCFIAQNILKHVAEKIHNTLKSFNETDSQISKTRMTLKKDSLSITQHGALLRWLYALGQDCDSIVNFANMLLDINVKYQDHIRSLKEDSEIKEEQFEKKLNRNQQSLMNLKEELRKEQENRGKVSKLKDAAIIKSSELEKQLMIKTKECEKLDQEREALQKSFNIAEELNLQIKSNLQRSSMELESYKHELDVEMGQTEKLSEQVERLSQELTRAGQEIIRLSDSETLAHNLNVENKKLTAEVAILKQKLEKFESQEKQIKRVAHEKESNVAYLEEELRKAYSKIELLTLYPDLNGPINAPMKASSNSCIETMELQVKSNQIRMEILRAQSERLTNTVKRLREHMKSNSKTDLNNNRKASRVSIASSTASS